MLTSDSANLQKIGARIALLRRAAGYKSQRAFARALGVSGGLVAQWEVGAKFPGPQNLAKLCELCQVTMDYLLGTEATTIDQREEKLLRAFRRLTVRQQQRLAEFIDVAVEARREVELESEPAET